MMYCSPNENTCATEARRRTDEKQLATSDSAKIQLLKFLSAKRNSVVVFGLCPLQAKKNPTAIGSKRHNTKTTQSSMQFMTDLGRYSTGDADEK